MLHLPAALPNPLRRLRSLRQHRLSLQLVFRRRFGPRFLFALRAFPIEAGGGFVEFDLAAVGGLAGVGGVLFVVGEEEGGLDVDPALDGPLSPQLPLLLLGGGVPAALGGADSAEAAAPGVGCLVELAHHINKIIPYSNNRYQK
jgi:hypothetical protein